jgi:cytochrome c oxidase accessory protein FixG
MSAPTTDIASPAAPLYAGRQKVYPKRVKGPIRRIKWAVLIACLAVYYITPWLRWDRGPGRPDQAILIDMPARRVYFFFIELWPQEIYYITGLLILGAIALFVVTSLFGRLWCGFTCPQTVWTDLFMWAERLIEGDRGARIVLDQRPWSLGKLARKAAKHLTWFLIALATGGAWIMYFNDAPRAMRSLVTLQASSTLWGFIGLFTATTYVLAGWAREQVCTYMCPWPRIQAAMIDEQTLTVSYRGWRGEPRAKYRKGDEWAGRGDCIDCAACVHACPTGIDIRDGLQLQCIGCGLCIDACDDVMSRIGRPLRLIAFAAGGDERPLTSTHEDWRHRLMRPRIFIYAGVLLVVSSVMIWALLQRSSLELTVLPDRNPLFVRLSRGDIRNSYTIKLENHAADVRIFKIGVTGIKGATMDLVEYQDVPVPVSDGVGVAVPADSVGTYHLHLRAPAGITGEHPVTVTAAIGREEARYVTTFHAPEH